MGTHASGKIMSSNFSALDSDLQNRQKREKSVRNFAVKKMDAWRGNSWIGIKLVLREDIIFA